MQFNVRVSFLKGKEFVGDKFARLTRYRNDDQFVTLDSDILTSEQIDKLFEQAKAAPKLEGSRGLTQKITAFRNVQSDPTGKKIGKLELLATALREYIKPSPNKWVFHDESDGYAVPYFVRDIQHVKGDPSRGSAAHVSVKLCSLTRGEEDGKSLTFYIGVLGRTVTEILHEASYYLETPAAVELYLEDIDLYKKTVTKMGSQFRCHGTGYPISEYSYKAIAMERDGQPAVVVLDDHNEESSHSRRTSASMTSNRFWVGATNNDSDDADGDGDDGAVVVPVHPYIQVFDLRQHEFVQVHVRNLTSYEYDDSAADKLVLDKDTKSLVTLLVEGSSEVLEDIIAGKTGGTIVIATGPPGTGKTLTAEVFAEKMKRPLYVVQCSQLGTNEQSLEKSLQRVLSRASRWNAILLIDEADVYVHERGADIQQNAIVGVFLRVLEHYRGVLFLTSNRSTIIDDAIMSRATAWIRYAYPTKEELAMLWRILATQYKITMPDDLVDALVMAFPKVSGRTIKNLLKLARMLLRGEPTRPVDEHLFLYVGKFLDMRLETPPTS